MNRNQVRELLEQVRAGEVDPEAATESLARMPFVDVPGARVDTHGPPDADRLRCDLQ